MGFLTQLALKRKSVALLAIALILVSGIFTYRTLQVELFPEIEFPLITIVTFYPSANPEAVLRDLTEPIEQAISGIDGLETIQSTSSENRSIVVATFKFGTDMGSAENEIKSRIDSLPIPMGVKSPKVGRVNPDSFPVLLLSVLGEKDFTELQDFTETTIIPAIRGVDGVFEIDIDGNSERRILVTVNTEKMSLYRTSIFQISQSLRNNNVVIPAGAIRSGNQTIPVKASNTYESIEELKDLVIAFDQLPPQSSNSATQKLPKPILLSDIAEVKLSSELPSSIFRTNGKQSIGLGVIKDPEANTIEVTKDVLKQINSLEIPSSIEVVTITNDGPEIEAEIHTLEQEALFGFLFAVIIVFAFMTTLKPTVVGGLINTLRPTMVIALSIPLSIFMGVLLMGWQGLSLNFMTLGGLAISVGRVVDDSIVVLENVYRHIQGGRDKLKAALEATVEVGPAITASTLATIVVFVPLGFIQGLVGSFFVPFALAISFALIASLIVALTAVPVLGAYLLRPGDLPDEAGADDKLLQTETWMQNIYTPVLKWSLKHKLITLIGAAVLTLSSLSLIMVIPITLFPTGGERILAIEMALPPGTSPDITLSESLKIEDQLRENSLYIVTTVGSSFTDFAGQDPGGFNQANLVVSLKEGAPENIPERLREQFANDTEKTVSVRDINAGGPPTSGLEVSVTGSDYGNISQVTKQLIDQFEKIDGITNIKADISEARDQILVDVDPGEAAIFGLTAQQISFQVSQFLSGQLVTQVNIDSKPLDVFLSGDSKNITTKTDLEEITISGIQGTVRLGDVANIKLTQGPVSISRRDKMRSANITGSIIGDNTQAIGVEVQEKIDSITLPPNIKVSSGGVFTQIAEGFQDIFIAMIVGILLIYLVMVASLGSLRNPFVIVTSLPLALIGALVALAITGKTLGLPAMMGILLLIGIVVTNAVVLITFVEQLREQGFEIYEALIKGVRIRLRPILMTAITTSIALLPLAVFASEDGGIIGAQLATVVIGGLASSTILTLIVVPVIYVLANDNIPQLWHRIIRKSKLP